MYCLPGSKQVGTYEAYSGLDGVTFTNVPACQRTSDGSSVSAWRETATLNVKTNKFDRIGGNYFYTQ